MRKLMWVILGIAGLAAVAFGAFLYVANSVETPPYTVVEAEEPFEIRDYPALRVAQITRQGTREKAVNSAFSPLAGYIFAKQRDGEKIAMTAPVTQIEADGAWVVRFIMPQTYTLDDLPKPAGSEVTLEEVPARRVAAIRFSGRADDAMLAEKEAALRAWLDGKAEAADGPATFAYYNDPFTPGFMRRNEVLIDLE